MFLPRPFSHQKFLMLALLCGLSTGCYSIPHSAMESRLQANCPREKQRVNVVIVESPVDALHAAQIPQITERIRQLGYSQSTLHDFYVDGGMKELAQRIRQIKQCDPSGKVLIVGWSAGSVMVRDALSLIEPEGYRVDTVIYLDSFTMIPFNEQRHPQNLDRTVLVYRKGWPLPKGCPNAVVYRISEWDHLALPTNLCAYDAILKEVHRLTDPCQQSGSHQLGISPAHLHDHETVPANGQPVSGQPETELPAPVQVEN